MTYRDVITVTYDDTFKRWLSDPKSSRNELSINFFDAEKPVVYCAYLIGGGNSWPGKKGLSSGNEPHARCFRVCTCVLKVTQKGMTAELQCVNNVPYVYPFVS